LLGYNKEEMLRMKVLDLYADTHYGKFKAEKDFNLFKEGESIRDVILLMRHKNGDAVWISLSIEPKKKKIVVYWQGTWHAGPPDIEVRLPGSGSIAPEGDQCMVAFDRGAEL
jgi:hypothetical protein